MKYYFSKNAKERMKPIPVCELSASRKGNPNAGALTAL